MEFLKTGRFIALDVLRGLTVFLMIVVNTQGGNVPPYSQLVHSDWNGCTLTDLVFPSFLFAMGNAMPFALAKFKSQATTAVLYKIVKRALLIFIIGFLLGWYATMHWVNGHVAFTSVSTVRIMAVLQRIALCYLIAAALILFFSVRWLIWVSVFFLLLYWVLLQMLGIPGMQYTITGNAIRWIDVSIFGIGHLYREHGVIFDPEGLLSTLPAVVNVLAGYLASLYIIKKGKTYECLGKLLLAGNMLLLAGLSWNYFLPMNKKMWTGSFVLFTTGIDLLALSFIFYWVELAERRKGLGLLIAFGKNPLFIYILSNLFLFVLIFPVGKSIIFIDWINLVFYQKIAPGAFGSLLFSVSFAMLMGAFAWIMDKNKIYVGV